MTRASDAARNTGDADRPPRPRRPDPAPPGERQGNGSGGTGSGGPSNAGAPSKTGGPPNAGGPSKAGGPPNAGAPAKAGGPSNSGAGSGRGGSAPAKSSSGQSGSARQSGSSGSSGSPSPSGGSGAAPPRQSPPALPPGRQPLPGPPPGARLPGPPMMAPRFAPPPRPRRPLTAGQRIKLAVLALALVAVGALLGSVVAMVLPTTYAAQANIQYTIAGENTGDFLKTDRNLTTQVVLITSRNVLQPVADANGISVDDLSKRVTATILNGSNIIQIQVKDRNRETGMNLANAIAKQYLTVSNSSGPQGYLQNQLNEVRRQLAAPRPGITAAETQALNARAATLQAQLDEMNVTANQSTVLTPAYSLTDPVSPNKGVAGLTGGVCGLLIALMTVVTLSRRWTRS